MHLAWLWTRSLGASAGSRVGSGGFCGGSRDHGVEGRDQVESQGGGRIEAT